MTKCFLHYLAIAATIIMGAVNLKASIVQNASVAQCAVQGTGGCATTLQQDSVGISGQGSITDDILAEFPKGYDPFATAIASASVGRFGAVGLLVHDFSNMESITYASVSISNDEFFNPIRVAQTALSRAVIDGGTLRIPVGTRIPNSYIAYSYTLSSAIPAISGAKKVGCSNGLLATDSQGIVATFNANVSVAPLSGCDSGVQFDLGATFDPATGTVTIPQSTQTFDLGLLPPLESMSITYSFGFVLFHGTQQGQASDLYAQFSDPFHLSANPVLGTITFEPAGAATPEPGTLLLLGCGLLGLGIVGRYRATPNRNSPC